MRHKTNNTVQHEVEPLVKEVTVEEAMAEVWRLFENALKEIEPENLAVLRGHFEGYSNEVLARRHGLTEEEVNLLVKSIKREILIKIRTGCSVRQ